MTPNELSGFVEALDQVSARGLQRALCFACMVVVMVVAVVVVMAVVVTVMMLIVSMMYIMKLSVMIVSLTGNACARSQRLMIFLRTAAAASK